MRISIISPEYPPHVVGGLGTHVQELARGLAKIGCRMSIFAANSESDELTRDGEVMIQFLRLPGSEGKRPYEFTLAELKSFSDWLVEKTVRMFRETDLPDIIHVHEWPGFEAAQRLRALLNIPIVTTIHAVYAELNRRGFSLHPDSARFVNRERECCLTSDRIIAVSQSVRREVAQIHGVPVERIEAIPNGLDCSSFSVCRENGGTLDQEDKELSEGQSTILFAGRIVPYKGLTALLGSAMQVTHEYRNVRYLIAGDAVEDGYYELIRSMVTGHPRLRERVTFLGKVPRDRLLTLYRRAAFAVVPSLYEPFGYAATEAMAAEKAVVATDTGGLSEIIRHGETGFLIPMTGQDVDEPSRIDVRKLADAQLRLLCDPSLANRLGRAGRLRVEREFSIEKMATLTLGCYQRLVAHRQRA